MWRATYTPGTWVVLSGPSSVVIMQPAPASASRLINNIWDAVLAAASIEELAQRLAAFGLKQMPSFGALFWHHGQMRSLVRGAVKIVDLLSGAVIADGEGIQTWAEIGLDDVRRVRVDMEPVDQDRLLQLPLVVGAVTASAIVVDATDAGRVRSPQHADERAGQIEPGQIEPGQIEPGQIEPGQIEPGQIKPEIHSTGPWPREPGFPVATPPPPPPAPPIEGPPAAVPASPRSPFARPGAESGWPLAPAPEAPATAPTEQIESLDQDPSMVLAVECPRQHPNPPDAQRCRQCGAPVIGQPPRPITRPVLATLRPSSGHPVEVDRAVLIGRAPTARQVPREDLPKMLTVPSPSHDISRNHVRVAPEGWSLLATDLHSTNGTFLIRPGRREPEPLRPGEPVAVYPGCVLDLGDGVTILVDHPG